MKKIYITNKCNQKLFDLFLEAGFPVEINPENKTLEKKELLQVLKEKNPEILITLLSDKVDSEILEAGTHLKLIGNYAVGFNNIDVQAAKEKGVSVVNCRGTSGSAVAQHVVSLILSLYSRILEGDTLIREQKWKGWDANLLMGQDLQNKTVGLVGGGNIGGKVAEILHKGFNCKILYSDLNANRILEENCSAQKLELNELLQNSDIVSLHVPLLESTQHLINADKLKLMKPSAILINTARGAVVDEEALIGALEKANIAGAGLDVFENEPNISERLRNLQNVVLTPHIASAKESARTEMNELIFQNVKNYLEDKPLVSEVI